jgi:glyoxylase-like metal-dependent hydrolase (beta-lactamase superfamily II)
MLKHLGATLALVVVFSVPGEAAQNAGQPQNVRALLQAADRAMGASQLRSVQYVGNGYITQTGQSYTTALDDTWPRFDVTTTRTIDYTTNSMREEHVRRQGTWPVRGGGLPQRPLVGENRQTLFVSGNFAWTMNAQGQPQAQPGAAEERQMEIIMTPHGFIRAALAAPDARLHQQVESSRTTRKVNIVTFRALGKYPINGWFNEQNLLVRTQTWLPHQLLGDLYIETRYTGHRNFGGVQFPTEMHRSWGNPPHPGFELHVTDVRPNIGNAAQTVPAAVRTATAQPVRVVSEQLAPGIWFLGGGSHHSVAIEFRDYSVIVEGPLNDERALAVIAETRRLIPNKPIRYVLNTHHHFDHSGGLRPFGADDIVVITHRSNFNFYEGVVFDLRPRTLKTDALSLAPRQVHYVQVDEEYRLTDGARILDIIHVPDIDHSGDMLIAHLPNERILIEADLYSPVPAGAPAAAATPSELGLYHAIKQNNLQVERIVPIHGRPVPMADFLRVVQPQQAQAQ